MDREEPSELIDTAIVIKNIPFRYPEEDFVSKLFPKLGLVQPHAFNYHRKSGGVFHGLAFANFNTSHDARTTVDKLNNFKLEGRPLRVELKKRLPAEEEQWKRLAKQSSPQIMQQMAEDILHPSLRPRIVYHGPPTPTSQDGNTNVYQAN
jgi:RNA recognition motif-containing protein